MWDIFGRPNDFLCKVAIAEPHADLQAWMGVNSYRWLVATRRLNLPAAIEARLVHDPDVTIRAAMAERRLAPHCANRSGRIGRLSQCFG